MSRNLIFKNRSAVDQCSTHSRFIASPNGRRTALVLGAAAVLAVSAAALNAQDHDPAQPFLPTPVRSVSTIPANGDINPYGVAFVPDEFMSQGKGMLHSGDILVSNFNNSNNLQGTGTTIVRIPSKGKLSVFFQAKPGVGLSTALNVLKSGYVLVGNFPSTDGTCATATAGSILVIDSAGKLVTTITDPSFINGPWDSAVLDEGSRVKLFIANGLTGTVSRLNLVVGPGGPRVESSTQIASGYMHQCDPVTFVDAPTGLVYDWKNEELYVASTVDNKVFAIHEAAETDRDEGTGRVIYQDNKHLHGPLGLAMAPNGHLLTSNNDVINPDPNQPSEIVEFTLSGKFVKEISVDPAPGGSFGLNVASSHDVATFAAVDDNASTLLIWTLPLE